jgi:hypothetical protein
VNSHLRPRYFSQNHLTPTSQHRNMYLSPFGFLTPIPAIHLRDTLVTKSEVFIPVHHKPSLRDLSVGARITKLPQSEGYVDQPLPPPTVPSQSLCWCHQCSLGCTKTGECAHAVHNAITSRTTSSINRNSWMGLLRTAVRPLSSLPLQLDLDTQLRLDSSSKSSPATATKQPNPFKFPLWY